MIKGIGSDIIEIDRIQKACEKERFLQRNFTSAEIELFKSKGDKAETIAVNFAMKEAIVKAIGTGFRGINLIDLEILRNSLGRPTLSVNEPLQALLNKYEIEKIHLTCSHTKAYAIGYAVAEG